MNVRDLAEEQVDKPVCDQEVLVFVPTMGSSEISHNKRKALTVAYGIRTCSEIILRFRRMSSRPRQRRSTAVSKNQPILFR